MEVPCGHRYKWWPSVTKEFLHGKVKFEVARAYQHRNERSFEEGDWVFLSLQPYKKMSLKQLNKDNKLAPKYYGLYKVLQKIGSMAYKLELPASSWVHQIFHVSCLKNVIGDTIPIQTILSELNEEGKSYWNLTNH